ncbi:coenzyme F420 hydrogenase subunit beta [Methanobrevibacter curvatus]|uniref:Coenzyme F420 hydrogenase subunit beta n=1 Tax=Methanobrevibacter curvatus TaxID=49547 RepID=A0A166B1Y3_9EURY|nr:coenzyme F420 hydrogenase subunit beta [Methanobrevibacter curvatus]KZX12761.1 coenzyme F420-reducing hydrogenase subunit beta [Methanobrevibacter curvatus]
MVLGTYKEALSARATDKQIQKVSQDGGIVTALLSYALDEKVIEGAVVAGPTDEAFKPEPLVALTADEIISAAGTKYTFSPNVWALKKAVRQYGLEKVGTVAIPCQLQGIRKMQSYPFATRFIADKIKLIVGIFCMENFPYASLETFVSDKLYSDLELVNKLDIGKGKFWAVTDDEELALPLKDTHGYEQAGCNICKDYVAELADVSTGSVGSPDGWSTVLPRTDAGNDIFTQAVDAGIIEVKPIADVKPGLGLLEKLAQGKKDKADKEIAKRAEIGLPVPF